MITSFFSSRDNADVEAERIAQHQQNIEQQNQAEDERVKNPEEMENDQDEMDADREFYLPNSLKILEGVNEVPPFGAGRDFLSGRIRPVTH